MIIKLEIAKILRTPAIWVFLLIALIVNTFFIFSTAQSDIIDYNNELTSITGTKYDEDFLDRLDEIEEPKVADDYIKYYHYLNFKSGAEEAHEVLDEVRGDKLRNLIPTSMFLADSPLAQRILSWKYDMLEPVIEQKIVENDSASVYFGQSSATIHEVIFPGLNKFLGFEICIIFILIMLYAIGFENMFNTESVVFSTKCGRNGILFKGLAAIGAALLFSLLLYAISSALMFFVNDFSEIWSQNISAQYNTVGYPKWGTLPFISWESMTFGEYAFGCAGITILHGLASGILAAVFGIFIRNVYIAFIALFALVFFHFALLYASGLNAFIFDLLLIPSLTQLIYNQWWFADGGPYALIPHFEFFYPIIFIAVMIPILLIALKRFKRKEFV